MSELDLHFNPGDLMQLELVSNDRHQKYAAKVIGFLRGQSLLVTTPMNRGKSILVREGQTFTARMMVGSSIVGFTAPTIRSHTAPYPYLHPATGDNPQRARDPAWNRRR